MLLDVIVWQKLKTAARFDYYKAKVQAYLCFWGRKSEENTQIQSGILHHVCCVCVCVCLCICVRAYVLGHMHGQIRQVVKIMCVNNMHT